MFRPVEGGAVLQHSVSVIPVFHGDEQHIVLIPELFPAVGHIAACHGHFIRAAAHKELDTVQLMDVMVEVAS